MQLNTAELSKRDLYTWMVRLIVPRPIAWVSTISQHGVANLAPFSFFNGVGANPPTIMFCPANNRDGTPKDTLANIRQNGQFVINLVTEPVAERMNLTSAEVQPDVDEFEMAGVARLESICVAPPRVAASAAAFECELYQAIGLGTGPAGANLVIGRILLIHVDDGLLDEHGNFDAASLNVIGRMGGDEYIRTGERFSMSRPKT